MAARSHPALCGARPIVFAHRGGAALAPENTMAAFECGLAAGADGLELDVRLSRDGVAVVHHDPDLGRTTNATGPLAARTADELAGFDAGYWFAADGGYPFRGRGLGIPRLRDVLARFPDIPLIVEVKGDDPAVARAAIEEIRAARAIDRVCLGGFSRRVLQWARRFEPRLPSGAARSELGWMIRLARVGCRPLRARCAAVHAPLVVNGSWLVTPRFVRGAHRAGLAVQVWVVDRAEDIYRLLAWGVDGVISDRPDVAAATVRDRALALRDAAPVAQGFSPAIASRASAPGRPRPQRPPDA